MNHMIKLQLSTVLTVLAVSASCPVQAADTPIVSSGGVAYNIGLQGSSFTNSDNVYLGVRPVLQTAILTHIRGTRMQREIILL